MSMTLDGSKGGASLTSNGYTYLPNGALMQWGLATIGTNSGNSATVTFPIAFPTACVSFTGTFAGSSVATTSNFIVSALTTTTATTIRENNANGDSFNQIYYIAIGY